MPRSLVVIDYTVDFVADEGSLTCGRPAQDIEDALYRRTKQFYEANDYVVFALDTHRESDVFHPESKLFPPHNLVGTPGRELYGKLATLAELGHDRANVYIMEKTLYSAFAGTDLEIRLRQRGIAQLHLAGVCSDICVLHTAVDGYNRGFSLYIHADCTQSFNPVGHRWALTHFRNTLGATILVDGRELTPEAFDAYVGC